MFQINQIDQNTAQVYGQINGNAFTKVVNGVKCWGFNISFFKGSTQVKVSSNEKDGTIWNLEKLKERIIKAYEE